MDSKYATIRALYALQANGATLEELKTAAIETAKNAHNSYELKQATNFIRGLQSC